MKMARFPIGCPSGKDSRIYKRQQINHRLLLMFPGAAQAIQGMKMARFPIGQVMIVRSTIVSRSTIVIVV
jgi:hypothetical protein